MKRHVIFIGAPGSGKGTQAQRMHERHGLVQISTGDMLREGVRGGTELGRQAKSFMDAGELVPDELIIGMIRERFGKGDLGRGWILDGFPRTVPQAEGLDAMLGDLKVPIEQVVVIDVPDEVLVGRVTGRRSCAQCGAVYHLEFAPPSESDRCDRCQATGLVHRSDDSEEKVQTRLKAYHEQTASVIPYYEDRGLLARVNGAQASDSVTAALEAALA